MVKKGRSKYKNVLRQVDEGVRPLYRSSSWKKEERALARKKKSKSWFGKQFDSVLFVESSPG